MKTEYIYELLRDNSRVIIPDFGAFLLKEKYVSSIGKDGFMQISFNDFLKFNDGLLVEYVARHERIDKIEAELQVKEFVSKIKYDLINTGSFTFSNMGELYHDEKGNLKFRQDENQSLKQGKDPAGGFSGKSTSENAEVPPPEDAHQEKKNNKTGLSPLGSGSGNSHFFQPETQNKETDFHALSKDPETPKRIETPDLSKTKKEQNLPPPPEVKLSANLPEKKLRPIWRYTINGLIIIAAILIVWLLLDHFLMSTDENNYPEKGQITQKENKINTSSPNQGEQNTSRNSTASPTEDTKVNPSDTKDEPGNDNFSTTVNNDPVMDEDQNLNNNEEDRTEKTGTKPKSDFNKEHPVFTGSMIYHTIAGSFTDKNEAWDLVLLLRNKGFDSRIINEKKGHYRVSYRSYTTKAEALADLQKIRKVNPEAWLLKYKIKD